ncbi:MAG: T9SS type A sorting domain-containing protein [Bacteroidota bacterium]
MKKRCITIAIVFLFSISIRAQWTQTNGPIIGNFTCFAKHGATIVAGSDWGLGYGGGIFTSSNNGATWSSASYGLNLGTNVKYINAFAVSGDTIYAATDYSTFKSTDNGASWVVLSSMPNVNSIAVNSPNIYLGTNAGLYISTDNGSTFTKKIIPTFPSSYIVSSVAVNGSSIYAFVNNTMLLSGNNGSTWTSINSGLTGGTKTILINGTSIFAAGAAGVFLTLNNGASWSAVNNGLTNTSVNSIAAAGGTIYATTNGGGIFYSTNSGSNWFSMNNGLFSLNVYSLFSNGSDFFAGTDIGVFYSANSGSAWNNSSTGIPSTNAHCIKKIGNTIFTSVGSGGMYVSSDYGQNWKSCNNGLPYYTSNFMQFYDIASSIVESGGAVFAACSGNIYSTNNNGNNWNLVNSLPANSANYLTAYGATIYASGQNGIYISNDSGASWSLLSSTSFTPTKLVKSGTNLLSMSSNNYASLYLSTDNGISWNAVNNINGNMMSFTQIYDITGNANELYVVGDGLWNGSMYKSSDNGVTWNAIGYYPGLPPAGTIIYSVAMYGSEVFAGAFSGIYSSTDNGNNWTSIGLSSVAAPNAIEISDTLAVVATDSKGVWMKVIDRHVWPGDANSDGVADNLDVLELGLHYTQTGAPRATISNSWQPYFANSWSGTITNGKNLNHSDCNGDGTINDNDTLAIYNNYGLTHTFKPVETNTVNVQLSIIPDQSAVAKGTWGTASIYLGDATTSINNINGIAFTVDFDNTLIETNNIYIEYQNSFLDAGQNLDFRKMDFTNSKIYTATTHTVSNNVSGYGKIATLHYQIKSTLTNDQVLNLAISQANRSNASGTIIPLTSGTSTLLAMGASVGLQELNANTISISPNPTNGLLTINSTTQLQNIEVVSITGQVLLSETPSNVSHTLHLENFSNGIYFVNVYQNDHVVKREKIILSK